LQKQPLNTRLKSGSTQLPEAVDDCAQIAVYDSDEFREAERKSSSFKKLTVVGAIVN
jgi:hypothetical protein